MYFLGFQQFGAEHRRERDSHEGGGTADYRHYPSQLMEHDTRHTGEHRQRHEHGYEHKGCCDNGHPNLIGSIDRCLMRVFSTLDMARYILQHHNSIIHHHTDSDSERTERDDIQRGVRHTEVYERHDEGNRNGYTDDDGSTPFTKEEEHDEHDEEERVKHRLFEGVDGVLDILRGVVYLLYLDIGRQLFLYLRQFGPYVPAYLYGVSPGLLGNNETHRLTSVGFLVQREVFDGIFDGSNIAHKDLLSLRCHSHHEVLYLGGLYILGAHLHLVLLFRHLDSTGG